MNISKVVAFAKPKRVNTEKLYSLNKTVFKPTERSVKKSADIQPETGIKSNAYGYLLYGVPEQLIKKCYLYLCDDGYRRKLHTHIQ